jgi:hypothetical protein
MGVGIVSLFLAYFCLSMGSLTIGSFFRFLWRYVGMYTSGLGRTTMLHYVNLNTSRLAAGA